MTNKIYVADIACWGNPPCAYPGKMTVIDGATNHTVSFDIGVFPEGVSVNPVTNKIYVVNKCGNDLTCNSLGTVSVIDGVTNAITTVNVGAHPYFAGVNTVTNKIYVPDNCGNDPTCKSVGTVTVIDGASNTTASVNVGVFPYGVAVDAVTNKIYVANNCGTDLNCTSPGTVSVIDGATNSVTPINVGDFPYEVTADVVTNKIYAVNTCGNDLTCQTTGSLSVIDGASDSVVPVTVGKSPASIRTNAATNKVYVNNEGDNTVSVIAGANAIPLQFVAVPPCRLIDTRKTGGAIPAGTFPTFNLPQLAQSASPPCTSLSPAAAFSLNVTVVPGGQMGYLSIWPTGEDQPVVSTMNSLDGRAKADAAILPAGYQGDINVYVTDTTNVVLDINGYFAPVTSSTLAFYPLAPCRIADTRNNTYPAGLGTPHLYASDERDFPVLSSSCIPAGVTPMAYSLNFTAVPYPSMGYKMGYLEVWPMGQMPQHPVSTLNNATGTIVANAAIVPAGTEGEIAALGSSDTDLIIDINGYFAPAGSGGLSLYPVAPCRVLDTRHIGNGQPFTQTLNPPVDSANSPCQPPAAAQAYVFNATVIPVASLGYLTLWPDGTTRPVVSTMNAADGWITNNMAIVPAGTAGKVDAYANGLTQLILDISSYFASSD